MLLSHQKHPHVIFEAKTKQNKGCANSGNLEWRNTRGRQQHLTGFVDHQDANGAGRYKRDVRDATKYIETAIIIDKAMFDKRNGSTRAEVVHDAIQVANIADLVRMCLQFNSICMKSFAFFLIILPTLPTHKLFCFLFFSFLSSLPRFCCFIFIIPHNNIVFQNIKHSSFCGLHRDMARSKSSGNWRQQRHQQGDQ